MGLARVMGKGPRNSEVRIVNNRKLWMSQRLKFVQDRGLVSPDRSTSIPHTFSEPAPLEDCMRCTKERKLRTANATFKIHLQHHPQFYRCELLDGRQTVCRANKAPFLPPIFFRCQDAVRLLPFLRFFFVSRPKLPLLSALSFSVRCWHHPPTLSPPDNCIHDYNASSTVPTIPPFTTKRFALSRLGKRFCTRDCEHPRLIPWPM